MSQPILYQRSVNQDLYVYALSSVYRSGYRIYDPDYALSREPDIYEKVRRDPVVNHAIQQRLHMIAGHKWIIEPRGDTPMDKQAARILTEMVEEIPSFTEARYELAQAVILGRTFEFIGGGTRRTTFGGVLGDWWTPAGLEDIDRRRFRFVPVWTGKGDGRKLSVTMQLYSIERDMWEDVEHPEWFIKHIYGDEEARLGHGRGLLESIYFYHWVKTTVFKEGLQGLERWAQGMVIAKIDGLRAADTGAPNQTVANAWLNLLEQTRGRNFVAADSKDEVDVKEPGASGQNMVHQWLSYLDDALTRLVLGSIRPTGGGSTGVRDGGVSEEANSTESLIQYDRDLLDETLTRDLLGALWRYNRPMLMAAGAGAAKMPRFRTVPERMRNPKEAVEILSQAMTAGMKFKEQEAYAAIGFSPPAEGDKIVEGRPPAPPALPGQQQEPPPFKAAP